MNKVSVIFEQSIFDIALQTTGTIANAMKIAQSNNLNITDDLTVNKDVSLPETVILSNDILRYYKQKKVLPATGLTKRDYEAMEKQEGISIWIINQDFIVQ